MREGKIREAIEIALYQIKQGHLSYCHQLDDIYLTTTKYTARGIREQTINAALIKLNQIGTVTETIEVVKMCYSAGLKYFLSHRSGETKNSFLADFAVAMGSGQLKTGSCYQGERIAKYNSLLED